MNMDTIQVPVVQWSSFQDGFKFTKQQVRSIDLFELSELQLVLIAHALCQQLLVAGVTTVHEEKVRFASDRQTSICDLDDPEYLINCSRSRLREIIIMLAEHWKDGEIKPSLKTGAS